MALPCSSGRPCSQTSGACLRHLSSSRDSSEGSTVPKSTTNRGCVPFPKAEAHGGKWKTPAEVAPCHSGATQSPKDDPRLPGRVREASCCLGSRLCQPSSFSSHPTRPPSSPFHGSGPLFMLMLSPLSGTPLSSSHKLLLILQRTGSLLSQALGHAQSERRLLPRFPSRAFAWSHHVSPQRQDWALESLWA